MHACIYIYIMYVQTACAHAHMEECEDARYRGLKLLVYEALSYSCMGP